MNEKKYFIGKSMVISALGPITLPDDREESFLFSGVDELSVKGIVVDSFFVGEELMLEIVDPVFIAIIWDDDSVGRIEVPFPGTSAIVAWSGQMTPKICYGTFAVAEDPLQASRPASVAH